MRFARNLKPSDSDEVPAAINGKERRSCCWRELEGGPDVKSELAGILLLGILNPRNGETHGIEEQR